MKRPVFAGMALAWLAVSSPVQAACTVLQCDGVLISRVVTDRTGDVFIRPSATIPHHTTFGCIADAGIYFGISMTTANAKELYSHILSAHLLSRTVSIKVAPGPSNYCHVAYIYTDD